MAAVLLPLLALGQTLQPFDSLSAQAAHAREAEHMEEAMRLYQQALQLQPQWAEGWWYLGTLAYDRQQFKTAADALSRLIDLAPNNANAFALLGLSEVNLDRSQSALSHLTQALQLGVGDEANLRKVVLFNQATLLLDTGAFGRAQEILDDLARSQNPVEDEVVVALGRSILGIQGSPQTRDLVSAAGKAESLAANRQTNEASAAYADLVKVYPKAHNVEFAYGRFLLQTHRDEEAVAAFRREIANSPQHLLARLGIAGTLLRIDPAGSLPYAEEAVKLAPKLEEAHYLLGAALLATDRAADSLAELEQARSLNGDDPRVYFALAKSYARLHREADAALARDRFNELTQEGRR